MVVLVVVVLRDVAMLRGGLVLIREFVAREKDENENRRRLDEG